MESPQQPPSLEQMSQKLAHELEAARDACTRQSLMLHDLKFEMDATHRRVAVTQAADCIARSQVRITKQTSV